MPSSRNIKHTGYITYMEEEWRAVVGYEGIYEVSSLGRINSLKRKYTLGRIMGYITDGRYNRVSLSKESNTKKYLVHRLLAIAFIPNPLNKPCINHIDNNGLNNNLSNLEWCTNRENQQHSARQGRNKFGEKNNKAKLKDKDIPIIRESKLTLKELGKIYNVHFSIIHDVKKRNTWKHIP